MNVESNRKGSDYFNAYHFYRDKFGLDEDGTQYIEIFALLSSDGLMNPTVDHLITKLQLYGLMIQITSEKKDLNDSDETQQVSQHYLDWSDRVKILIFCIDNLDLIPKDIKNLNAFLILYIKSIMKES